ncbi:MAG: hypothetical protein EZS28_007432, partial [Streblomastix strix]
ASKILNIVVVTAVSDVQVSVPTDRLINENCSIVSIKRDYIESNEYPVRKAAGRLFSQPGAVNSIFKVEAISLILSNLDLVSIGPASGSAIQGESLITGIGKSQIELNNVLLTMGEIIEGIFHSIPTSTAQPSHSLKSFIDIQDSILTIKNFTAQRGQFVGRGAFSIDQKDGIIKIEHGKFLDCKIVRSSTPSSIRNKMLNEDSSAGAIYVSMERGSGSYVPNISIDKCSFTSCGGTDAISGACLFAGSGSSDNYGQVSITNSDFIYCVGSKTGAIFFDNDIVPQNAQNNGFLGNKATLASVNKGNIRSRNTAKLSSSSVETASDIFFQSKDRLDEAGGIMKVANGYHQLDGGSQGEVRISGYQTNFAPYLECEGDSCEIPCEAEIGSAPECEEKVKEKKKGIPGWVIALIIASVLLILAVVGSIIIIYLCCIKKNNIKKSTNNSDQDIEKQKIGQQTNETEMNTESLQSSSEDNQQKSSIEPKTDEINVSNDVCFYLPQYYSVSDDLINQFSSTLGIVNCPSPTKTSF